MIELPNGHTIDTQHQLVWGPTHKKLNWYKTMDLQKDGWLVPTKKQLEQTYEDKVPGFEKTWFWSSSSHVGNPEDAWYVNFYSGYVHSDYKDFDSAVRCVRPIGNWIFEELGLKRIPL